MKLPILLAAFVLTMSTAGISQIPITAKPAFFNDWGLTPNSVYGRAPVANTAKRAYFKIWKPDPVTVKIQTYDAAGILGETVVLRFKLGALSQETRTDEW